MTQVLLALAVVVLAAGVGEIVRRRRIADPPTQPRHATPSQLDRSDFEGDGWLVAVFTSDTCSTCADVLRKAEAVRSAEVSVQRVGTPPQRCPSSAGPPRRHTGATSRKPASSP